MAPHRSEEELGVVVQLRHEADCGVDVHVPPVALGEAEAEEDDAHLRLLHPLGQPLDLIRCDA